MKSYYSPSLIQIAARVPEPGANKLSEFKTISFLFWLFDRRAAKYAIHLYLEEERKSD
jgi:hypothetical protein